MSYLNMYYFVLITLCVLATTWGLSEDKIRIRRDAEEERAFYLAGTKLERQCFKDLAQDKIESVSDCNWVVGSVEYPRTELEDNKEHDDDPRAGEKKCSIIHTPFGSDEWTCYYTVDDKQQTTTYKFTHGEEMSTPAIEANGTKTAEVKVREGSFVVLNCTSSGVPAPDLKFSSDVPLNEEQKSMGGILAKAAPAKEHNGKLVNCTGSQNIEGSQPKASSITLDVLYVPFSDSSKSDFNKKNGSLTLTFTFQANPEPTINWTFAKKDDVDMKKPVTEQPRYIAQKIKKEADGAYSASLLISGETNEDLDTCFYLTVENEVGKETFDNCPDDGGDSVAVIAGILIAVGILISILIAGFVIYRKKIRATYMRASTN